MLSSDRPISCAGEDELGHQPFAAVLSRGLREMAPSEGMVIALHAPWGSGKTSVLNLVQRHMAVLDVAAITGRPVVELAALAAARDNAKDEEERTRAQEWAGIYHNNRDRRSTTVVRFNPWYFSGQESLFKAFFGVLGTELSLTQNTALARAVGKVLRRGAEAGTAAGAVAGAATGGPVGAAGGAAVGGFFGRFLGDRFDDKESLEASLRELRGALTASDKRFLVILDDMDRLMPDELRHMLSLLKSLGQLPNVIYLAAYDRQEVSKLLKLANIDSEAYLEKIVQASFELPKSDRYALRALLFARLDAIRQGEPIEDAQRWGWSYFSFVDPYLETPRHVMRLANAIQVVWPSVKGEVDWSDLVVLETLRLQEPTIYSKFASRLDLLTGAERSLREEKTWADDLSPVPGECTKPEVAKAALADLFPLLDKAWDSRGAWGHDEHKSNRDRRLCSPNYTRNYFALAPSPDQFSAAEIRELARAAEPAHAFGTLLVRAKERKTARGFTMVSRLIEQITEEIKPDTPLSLGLGRALLTNSDEMLKFRDAHRGLLEIDNAQRLSWLFVHALRALPDEKRCQEFLAWLPDTEGITFVAPFAETLTSEEARRPGEAVLPADCHARVRAEVVDRVNRAVSQDGLLSRPQAIRFLYAWARLSNYPTVSSWLNEQIKNDDALLNLAERMPSEVHSSHEGVYYVVDAKAWANLVDADHMLARLNDITPSIDEVRVKQITTKYTAALNRYKEKGTYG